MKVNKMKVQQLITENQLEEKMMVVSKAECIELNKQEIYSLSVADKFIISKGTILDKKERMRLSFGWIIQSSFAKFQTSQSIFNNINFASVYIKESQFYNTIFINCSFEDVDFDTCRFQDTYFINCTFDPTRIHNSIANNCVFYHCTRDRLNIDADLLDNIGFLDLEEAKVEMNDIHQEEVENWEDDCEVLSFEEGEVYQLKKIRKECFEGQKVIKGIIISDSQFAFNHIFSFIRFEDCEFINLTFSNINSLFRNNEFVRCEFSGIHLDTEIIECTFDSCKFERMMLTSLIKASVFNNCDFDDREKMLSHMESTEVMPKNMEDDQISLNSVTLFKGYKTILLTTLIQAKAIATDDKDIEMVDKLLKLANCLGGKLPQQEDVLKELKTQITKLEKKDQKDLLFFIQGILFENI